jgi:hypothetical protein
MHTICSGSEKPLTILLLLLLPLLLLLLAAVFHPGVNQALLHVT